VTGPVARFARQIAGQGYICAAPSSYHEFTGPEPLKYDAEDTDKGNAWKIGKVGYPVLSWYTYYHIDRIRIELLTSSLTIQK
jgi:dienelactone hydrolase